MAFPFALKFKSQFRYLSHSHTPLQSFVYVTSPEILVITFTKYHWSSLLSVASSFASVWQEHPHALFGFLCNSGIVFPVTRALFHAASLLKQREEKNGTTCLFLVGEKLLQESHFSGSTWLLLVGHKKSNIEFWQKRHVAEVSSLVADTSPMLLYLHLASQIPPCSWLLEVSLLPKG